VHRIFVQACSPRGAVVATPRFMKADTFIRTHYSVRAVNFEMPQSWIESHLHYALTP